MVVKAICGEKSLLDGQTHYRLDKSCKNIPLGLPKVLPKDNVQWGEKCDKRRIIFAGSWLMVHGEWL